jgi:hypothetical protein
VCKPVLPAVGVTLYNVNVRNNAVFDVDLDSVSNDNSLGAYGPFIGFVNGSCIIPDLANLLGHGGNDRYFGPVAGIDGSTPPIEISVAPYGSGGYNNTLSNPLPNNAATGYGVLVTNGGTCPDPGWAATTPAPSHNPAWRVW